jgi:hypothetical protein
MSKEYKLPPKNTIGVITKDGIIDICSKLELTTPIKKPNKAKVKETNINKKIINSGYLTVTSTKNEAVIKITAPTINVLVAPAPTKARTISSVEIGAAKISLIVPLNLGKNIPNEVLLIDWVSNVNINNPGTMYEP